MWFCMMMKTRRRKQSERKSIRDCIEVPGGKEDVAAATGNEDGGGCQRTQPAASSPERYENGSGLGKSVYVEMKNEEGISKAWLFEECALRKESGSAAERIAYETFRHFNS